MDLDLEKLNEALEKKKQKKLQDLERDASLKDDIAADQEKLDEHDDDATQQRGFQPCGAEKKEEEESLVVSMSGVRRRRVHHQSEKTATTTTPPTLERRANEVNNSDRIWRWWWIPRVRGRCRRARRRGDFAIVVVQSRGGLSLGHSSVRGVYVLDVRVSRASVRDHVSHVPVVLRV